jgi:pectin methylesterase-like acyl-CoA thioesterase
LDEEKVLQDLNVPDIVVAKDGSGNFTKVQEAVDYASKTQRKRKDGRFVIYVKAGIYEENVEIGWAGKKITMVGDGIGKTIVTASRSVGKNSTTYKSATVGTYLRPLYQQISMEKLNKDSPINTRILSKLLILFLNF